MSCKKIWRLSSSEENEGNTNACPIECISLRIKRSNLCKVTASVDRGIRRKIHVLTDSETDYIKGNAMYLNIKRIVRCWLVCFTYSKVTKPYLIIPDRGLKLVVILLLLKLPYSTLSFVETAFFNITASAIPWKETFTCWERLEKGFHFFHLCYVPLFRFLCHS